MTPIVDKKLLFILGLLLIPGMAAARPDFTGAIGGPAEARAQIDAFVFEHNLTHIVSKIVLKDYYHEHYAGYAYFNPRVIYLYRDAWENPDPWVRSYLLRHELGHLIAQDRGENTVCYECNEARADFYAEALSGT